MDNLPSTTSPSTPLTGVKTLPFISELELADLNFDEPVRLDVLIEVDVWPKFKGQSIELH